jgi:hypothetical protein
MNAHLIAAIAEAQQSPGGRVMLHQSQLYAGRVQVEFVKKAAGLFNRGRRRGG